MTHRNLIISFTLFLFGLQGLSAQETALYEWRDHLPYNRGLAVAQVGSHIYCATPYSLFYLDLGYNSLHRLNKVNGLSDANISDMAYAADMNTLVVSYVNANLDLIRDGRIVNLSDIKRKPILGNKTINRIIPRGKFAYLACGFGIVVVDMEREEIKDTWYIGPDGSQINVMDLTFDDTHIYAATEKGIYKAESANPFLAYYGSWEKMANTPVPNGAYNAIMHFSGRLVVNNVNPGYADDTVFVYNQSTQNWGKINIYNRPNCYRMSVSGEKLFICNETSVTALNSDMSLFQVIYNPSKLSPRPRGAFIDKDGLVWLADNRLGLMKTWGDGWNAETFTPNGPYATNVFNMQMRGNELWVASGGRKSTWENVYMKDGVYNYSGGTWYNYNQTNTQAFDSIVDMICVAIDPTNSSRAFVGSWGQGILEFNDRKLTKVYDENNSTLEGFIAWTSRVFISGLAFDSQNDLWVANSGAPSLLHRKKPDGSWTAFNLGGSASGVEIGKLVIDQSDQKWMLMRKDHSLLVFNEKVTTGSKYRILGSAPGNGAIPGNRVMSIAVDLDGEVWIGTDAGVAVFYNPTAVFSNSGFDAQRILVEQDGYVQYLLENETVTAIAIDGANRKWIGTDRAGVFLLSADGTKQIFNFTEDNSPLLSNSISDIAVGGNGEVFIGTALGIVGFKSDSPSPTADSTDVYAYPNPVREYYQGPIYIKGLPSKSDIKITSISGKLVQHIPAGQPPVWKDGRGMDGQRVQSGVYLVFAATEDGSEKLVTKILFIN